MVRLRIVKDYGTAGWKINLYQQDIEDLNLKDGSEVDIDVIVNQTKQKETKK